MLAEEHLARRIAAERDAKGWTNDGLAKRMTDAGCPMTGSAIFKIEKGEPRRRIVVDELVAFAAVFGIPVDQLLLPPEAMVSREVVARLMNWQHKQDAARAASLEAREAWDELKEFTDKHPALRDLLAELLVTSAQHQSDDSDGELRAAKQLWDLTGSPDAAKKIHAEMERLAEEDPS